MSAAAPAMILPGQFNVTDTGAFTYTIPIAVPPGTAGMMPALSLDYSSQNNNNGLVGAGWAISGLPSITRCPQTIATDGTHGGVNYDGNDRFCLNGQKLIAYQGDYGANGTNYRTEVDGFTRVRSFGHVGTGPEYFLVWTKAGQIMEMGNTADSKGPLVPVACTYPQQTCPSNDSSTVRVWAVNKISDTAGNYLTVTYNGGTPDTTYGEMYPTEIDYTANDNAGVAAYNSVRFYYAVRNDQVPVYQAGFLTETVHLLTDIRTYAGSTYEVSHYELAYNQAANSAQADQLTSVTLCDHNSVNCLAPTTFEWQGGSVQTPTAVSATLHGELHTVNRSLSSSDYNNDGLVDATVLQEPGSSCPAGTQSANYGSSDGVTFTAANIQTNYGSNQTNQDCNGTTTFLQDPNTILTDFNADGFTDVLEHQFGNNGSFTNNWFALLNDGNKHLNAAQFMNLGSLTPQVADFFGLGQPTIYDQSDRAMWTNDGDGTFTSHDWSGDGIDNSNQTTLFAYDFDGDGCADLMAQGNQTAVFYMCNPVESQLSGITGWDYYWHNGYHPTFGDFNGDGKTDILWVGSNNHVRLWLSTGTGFVEFNLDNTMDGISSDTVVTGDWNGDGKTDIALIPTNQQGTSNYTIQLSTGTGFIQGNGGAQIDNPKGRDIDAYAADWNSDGGPDIWVQFADDSSYDTEYLYDYTPLRIYQVWNGLGNATTVSYDRLNSGNVYARTQTSSYPYQDIDGPIYVVSKIASGNGVGGNYASTYAYEDLISHLTGRGMQGFAQMTVTDSQTGIIQTTAYRTDYPYTGLVATQTKTCPASVCNTSQDVIISQTSNSYSIRTKNPGTSPNEYYYDVEPTTTVVQSNESDGTPLPTVETDYNNYDGYGNPQEVVVTTAPPGDTLKQWDAKKTSENAYNNTDDPNNWILGRLTSSAVTAIYNDPYAGTSSITRSTSFTYASGSGILNEELVEPSAATCNDPNNPTDCFLKTDYQLDAFGHHQLATVSAAGLQYGTARSTETDYDTTTYHGQFPTTVTNNLGESETWNYDVNWGTPTSQTGPNGKTSTWTADTFGRPSSERHVDLTYVTHSYAYCAGINGGSDPTCPNNGAFLVTINTFGTDDSTHIAPIKRIYYDCLSREIADDVQGFDGSWIRVDTLYNANGQISKKSRPYFLSNPNYEVYDFYRAYDPLGRARAVSHPDGSNTFYNYSGLTSSVIDQYGNTTTTMKNDLGQVQTVQDPLGNTTEYAYDAYGELVHTIDPDGNMTTAVYDLRGHKLQSSDPDMGTWTYTVDGVGEILSQTDAKSQTVTMTYDGLGRMITRSEPYMASTWIYGIGGSGSGNNQGAYPDSAGKLVVMKCTGSACGTGNAYERDYTYTNHLQPYTQTITQGSAMYWSRPLYDSLSGRIAQVRYFSGYTIDDNYNATGYLSSIVDDQSGFWIWQADQRDAELRLVQSDVGGSILHEWQNFDQYTGRILNICATTNTGACDGNLVNLSYNWDKIGNLAWRSDAFANNTNPEYFCYDADSRVTAYSFYGSVCTAGANYAVTYDALGNITAKTDVNDSSCVTNNTPCYLYGTTGAGPHAVSEIMPCSNCTVDNVLHGNTANFYYDANGNLNCVTTKQQCDGSAARSQTWTSFNMVSQLTQGGTTISFTYDPSHQRASETESVGGTITNFADYPEIGVMAERVQTGGKFNWRNYIMVDGHMVAIRTALSGQSPMMFYPVLDHLGSMAALVDGNMLTVSGQPNPNYTLPITRYSYDAFGMPRDPINWTPLDCTKGPKPPFVRGFIGQEHLPDNVCLINLNARMYDEQIGRFISADPTVEAIYDGQDLNRYSYAGNNPLAFTDPSGLCFMGCVYKSPIFGAALDLSLFFFGLPELEVLTNIAASLGTTVYTGVTVGDIVNAGVAGGLSGAVTSGRLKGGLMGAAQGVAMAGVAPGMGKGLGSVIANPVADDFIAHGFVGGLFNISQKGGFASGFLAAGVGSLPAPIPLDQYSNGLEVAALGGAASVLGGGKFANGAATAAMSYAADYAPDPNEAADSDLTSNDQSFEETNASEQISQPAAPIQLAQLFETVPFADPLVEEPLATPEGMTPLDQLPPGSAGGPGAGKAFPRAGMPGPDEDMPDCTYCGEKTTREPGPRQLNRDHIIPRSQNGNDTPDNEAPACRTCNLQKGGRTPEQWYRAKLTPYAWLGLDEFRYGEDSFRAGSD